MEFIDLKIDDLPWGNIDTSFISIIDRSQILSFDHFIKMIPWQVRSSRKIKEKFDMDLPNDLLNIISEMAEELHPFHSEYKILVAIGTTKNKSYAIMPADMNDIIFRNMISHLCDKYDVYRVRIDDNVTKMIDIRAINHVYYLSKDNIKVFYHENIVIFSGFSDEQIKYICSRVRCFKFYGWIAIYDKFEIGYLALHFGVPCGFRIICNKASDDLIQLLKLSMVERFQISTF